jgi:isoquinoline 1-oxidoreductase beta subunit
MRFLNSVIADSQAARSNLSRRGFLMASGGVAAGLVVGFGAAPSKRAVAAASGGAGAFNPFVRIAPDGTVTVIVKHLDKGQGTLSGADHPGGRGARDGLGPDAG